MATNESHGAFIFETGRWTKTLSLPALPTSASPPDQALGPQSVSCPTDTSCTAVDGNGFAYHWNGQKWDAPVDALPPGNEHVSCPEPQWCMFMNAQSYEAVWDGHKWSGPPVFVDPRSMEISQPSGETSPVSWGQADYGVLDLSCGSRSLCIAVDDAGYAVAYNGKTWSTPGKMAEELDNLETVTCGGSLVCMAVNDGKVVIGRS